jgi:hypothetical protein
MKACQRGRLDVVKYLCEVGGKELLMATSHVRVFKTFVLKLWWLSLWREPQQSENMI